MAREYPWDLLHLAYFCGYAGWNYLTTPFLFTYPGFETEEIEPWEEEGEIRSEEHTSELQSLMLISYAVFCLKKKRKDTTDSVTKSINRNSTPTYSHTKY